MKDVDDRAEAVSMLSEVITNPTARVDVCGQFPEDTSTVQNFEQISEGQDLYSKEQLIEAYFKGKSEDSSSTSDEEVKQ